MFMHLHVYVACVLLFTIWEVQRGFAALPSVGVAMVIDGDGGGVPLRSLSFGGDGVPPDLDGSDLTLWTSRHGCDQPPNEGFSIARLIGADPSGVADEHSNSFDVDGAQSVTPSQGAQSVAPSRELFHPQYSIGEDQTATDDAPLREEQLERKLAQERKKLSHVCKRLRQSREENEILKAENASLIDDLMLERNSNASATTSSTRGFSIPSFNKADGGGSLQMLLNANAKFMMENARLQMSEENLRKSFRSHISSCARSSEADKKKIDRLLQKIKILEQRLDPSPGDVKPSLSEHTDTEKASLGSSLTTLTSSDLRLSLTSHDKHSDGVPAEIGSTHHLAPGGVFENSLQGLSVDVGWSRHSSHDSTLANSWSRHSSHDSTLANSLESLHSIPEQGDGTYEDEYEGSEGDFARGGALERRSSAPRLGETERAFDRDLPRSKSDDHLTVESVESKMLVDFGEKDRRKIPLSPSLHDLNDISLRSAPVVRGAWSSLASGARSFRNRPDRSLSSSLSSTRNNSVARFSSNSSIGTSRHSAPEASGSRPKHKASWMGLPLSTQLFNNSLERPGEQKGGTPINASHRSPPEVRERSRSPVPPSVRRAFEDPLLPKSINQDGPSSPAFEDPLRSIPGRDSLRRQPRPVAGSRRASDASGLSESTEVISNVSGHKTSRRITVPPPTTTPANRTAVKKGVVRRRTMELLVDFDDFGENDRRKSAPPSCLGLNDISQHSAPVVRSSTRSNSVARFKGEDSSIGASRHSAPEVSGSRPRHRTPKMGLPLSSQLFNNLLERPGEREEGGALINASRRTPPELRERSRSPVPPSVRRASEDPLLPERVNQEGPPSPELEDSLHSIPGIEDVPLRNSGYLTEARGNASGLSQMTEVMSNVSEHKASRRTTVPPPTTMPADRIAAKKRVPRRRTMELLVDFDDVRENELRKSAPPSRLDFNDVSQRSAPVVRSPWSSLTSGARSFRNRPDRSLSSSFSLTRSNSVARCKEEYSLIGASRHSAPEALGSRPKYRAPSVGLPLSSQLFNNSLERPGEQKGGAPISASRRSRPEVRERSRSPVPPSVRRVFEDPLLPERVNQDGPSSPALEDSLHSIPGIEDVPLRNPERVNQEGPSSPELEDSFHSIPGIEDVPLRNSGNLTEARGNASGLSQLTEVRSNVSGHKASRRITAPPPTKTPADRTTAKKGVNRRWTMEMMVDFDPPPTTMPADRTSAKKGVVRRRTTDLLVDFDDFGENDLRKSVAPSRLGLNDESQRSAPVVRGAWSSLTSGALSFRERPDRSLSSLHSSIRSGFASRLAETERALARSLLGRKSEDHLSTKSGENEMPDFGEKDLRKSAPPSRLALNDISQHSAPVVRGAGSSTTSGARSLGNRPDRPLSSSRSLTRSDSTASEEEEEEDPSIGASRLGNFLDSLLLIPGRGHGTHENDRAAGDEGSEGGSAMGGRRSSAPRLGEAARAFARPLLRSKSEGDLPIESVKSEMLVDSGEKDLRNSAPPNLNNISQHSAPVVQGAGSDLMSGVHPFGNRPNRCLSSSRSLTRSKSIAKDEEEDPSIGASRLGNSINSRLSIPKRGRGTYEEDRDFARGGTTERRSSAPPLGETVWAFARPLHRSNSEGLAPSDKEEDSPIGVSWHSTTWTGLPVSSQRSKNSLDCSRDREEGAPNDASRHSPPAVRESSRSPVPTLVRRALENSLLTKGVDREGPSSPASEDSLHSIPGRDVSGRKASRRITVPPPTTTPAGTTAAKKGVPRSRSMELLVDFDGTELDRSSRSNAGNGRGDY